MNNKPVNEPNYITVSNEFALRSSMDRREYSSDGDFNSELKSRLKTVQATTEHLGLELLAAEECPEDPDYQDEE